jgi:hypothetical protein
MTFTNIMRVWKAVAGNRLCPVSGNGAFDPTPANQKSAVFAMPFLEGGGGGTAKVCQMLQNQYPCFIVFKRVLLF